MDTQQADQYVQASAQFLGNMQRSPVLHRPSDFGLAYEDVFFPAMDGTVLDGWFIPADSDKLIIANHFIGANKSGYPGHLEEYPACNFEINFIPIYKILHEAGYNVLAYDLRGHGLSANGPGAITALGMLEYRDVIGSIHYAKSRPDTANMKVSLHTICGGCNATLIAMDKHPEEFTHIQSMIALQPISCKPYAEANLGDAGVENAVERFDDAFRKLTGFRVSDYEMSEYAKSVNVPTFVIQVRNDPITKNYDIQAIHDNIPVTDKKLFWIESTTVRLEAYRYFANHPEQMLEWYNTHM